LDENKMLDYARDLRADLKYAWGTGEGQTPNYKDIAVMDWLIEQAEKFEIYEKALTKIATKKMSMYISSSHMNQDFIKVANDALEEGLTGD
jgi:hypothetical protein